jgi:hypothetical protein
MTLLVRLEGEPWDPMVCSFCSTDNRAENRFCGMCGVRLDRRTAERRVNSEALQLKCPSCSYVNEKGYKFCGQCGTRIDRRINERRGSVVDTRATAGANASLPSPEDARLRTSGSSLAVSGGREDGLPSAPTPSSGIFVNDVRGNEVRGNDTRHEELRDKPGREELRRDGSPGRDMSLRHEVAQPVIRESPLRDGPSRNRTIRDSDFHGSEQDPPGITGPSFLGLGNDPENEGEYLLEDESGSGAGLRRLILLVVLAAIVGLIFMQWRSSLKANPKAPELSPSAAPARQGNSSAPASPSPPGQKAGGQEQSTLDSGTVSADTTKSDKGANGSDSGKKSQTDTLARADDPGILPNAADRNPSEGGSASDASKPNIAVKSSEPAKASDDAKSNEPNDPATSATNGGKADSSKSSAVVDTATVYPSAPVRPSAALLRAQQFLQGRGVPQNCEQGLIYLRAATQRNEPAAAVQMGALYSAGHCVKQDRVMAYRWFNSAHELQPANQWIQKSMDQLWAQMTQQERRLSGY